VAKLKYLVTTVVSQNFIHEEIKSSLNSRNTCYISVQNLLSSRLLFKNLKIKIRKTITLPVVLYWCENWSVILTEEHRLRVFEIRVLRRIFGPEREEVAGDWRTLHNEGLHNFYASHNIIKVVKSRTM
jgi:hypothetical protein